ncbi:MAG: hypothetical protein V4544_02545 [Pseudomonadota bacterium]
MKNRIILIIVSSWVVGFQASGMNDGSINIIDDSIIEIKSPGVLANERNIQELILMEKSSNDICGNRCSLYQDFPSYSFYSQIHFSYFCKKEVNQNALVLCKNSLELPASGNRIQKTQREKTCKSKNHNLVKYRQKMKRSKNKDSISEDLNKIIEEMKNSALEN